jgi:hypothetical protein
MSIFHNTALAGASGAAGGGAGGYEIERSLRFNSSDIAYLSRTPASAGNRKTWTWAGWVKRSPFSNRNVLFAAHTGGAGNYNTIEFEFDQLSFFYGGAASGPKTTAVFRDPSAWMHVCVALDTTQATASNRVKIYVNGVQQAIASGTYPTQNADLQINATSQHEIGMDGGYDEFNGYLADIHFIDGQALDPSSFGEFDDNGVWQPIDASGLTYGTNGFHLPFSDNSTAAALGTDTSGNGNTWTVNNLSVAAGAGNDSLVDTPTNYGTDTGAGGEVRGNYATLNPLNQTASVSLTNGNIQYTNTATNDWMTAAATFGLASGKWYFEAIPTGMDANNYMMIGAANLQTWSIITSPSVWNSSTSYTYFGLSGDKWNNGINNSYGSSYTNNDVIGVALDVDGGKIWFSKNGVWQASGDPAAGTNAAYTGITATPLTPVISSYSNNTVININFGQRPFAYTAPSGFKALCTTNLAEPTIADGSTAMDVALYTGNGSTQTISGLNFSPDFVWLKGRSNVRNHGLFNTVAGVNRGLHSNLTDAEFNDPSTLTTFNSDGFALGTNVTFNGSTETFVAWTWDAGSSTVTNTQGSITSQVRANASAGFSVQTWTASGTSSMGHGLGVTPEFIIVKRRNSAQDWYVWHKALTFSQYLFLNSTAATNSFTNIWGASGPSSSVFTFSASPGDHVSYCFAPVAGYSSFGSYTGNGSADGPFVYTGFRPRWVMWKSASTGGSVNYDWIIQDTTRAASNVVQTTRLSANTSNSESSDVYVPVDILSNGFKMRGTGAEGNGNTQTYIYAAFAESPFAYSRAR